MCIRLVTLGSCYKGPGVVGVPFFLLFRLQGNSTTDVTLEAQLPIYWVPVLKFLFKFILSVTQGPTIWVPGLLGLVYLLSGTTTGCRSTDGPCTNLMQSAPYGLLSVHGQPMAHAARFGLRSIWRCGDPRLSLVTPSTAYLTLKTRSRNLDGKLTKHEAPNPTTHPKFLVGPWLKPPKPRHSSRP